MNRKQAAIVALLFVRLAVLGWFSRRVYFEAGPFTAFAVVSGYVFAELLWQWVRDSHELVMRATTAAERSAAAPDESKGEW